MLSIAHILGYLNERYGGPPHSVLSLGRISTTIGANVSYWATGNDSDRLARADLGSSVHILDTTWPKSWYRSPGFLKSLESEINHIDILHLHELWTYPLLMTTIVAKKRKKPYLLSPRGILTQKWRYNTPKKRAYLSLFGNRIIHEANCLHALNLAEVEGFREAGFKGPVCVIPNGVNPEEFSDLPDPHQADELWPLLKDRRVVLFLSRFSPEKGLDELIHSWAEVVKSDSFDDAVLVLAGPDERGYGSVIRDLIENYGIKHSVMLPGLVVGEFKQLLLSRADFYVLPSHSEGFSVSLLENLACGNPVLITPNCNFPEVSEFEAGLVVLPERKAMSQGIRQLLDLNEEERLSMGERGQRLVRSKYTWGMAARKLLTVYDCILRGNEVPFHPDEIPLDKSGKAIL